MSSSNSEIYGPSYDLHYQSYSKECSGYKVLPKDEAHPADKALDIYEKTTEKGVEVYKPRVVRVALFGLGRIGIIHFRNLISNLDIEILYCVEACQEKINYIEFRYRSKGIKFVHLKDSDVVFNDPQVDAVVICTPTQTHQEIILKALKAKKAVMCEKPLADSSEGMAKCYQLAKEANLPLLCCFNRRWDPTFVEIRNRVKRGDIGQLQVIKTCARDSPLPSLEYIKTSGGIFHDCAVHDIDLVCWVVGEFPISVSTHAHSFLPQIAELDDFDTVSISMKFPSGIIGIIDLSRNSTYGYDQRLEVFGNKGMISSTDLRPTAVVSRTIEGTTAVPTCFSFASRYEDGYKLELEHFINCIKDPSLIEVKEEQCLNVTTIASASEESARTQKMLDISYKKN